MIYSNFTTMVRDIEGWVRATGDEILSCDDPMQGHLGFCTADGKTEWKIPMAILLSQFMSDGPRALPKIWAEALCSSEGRATLAKSVAERAKMFTITDPDRIAELERQWHDRMDSAERTAPSEPGGHAGWKVEAPGDDRH